MKEFACKSLGNNCGWRHIARTEELLADVVAVHLRDVHGVNGLAPDKVGKIKNLFTNPTPVEAEAAENLVLKEYACDRRKVSSPCVSRLAVAKTSSASR